MSKGDVFLKRATDREQVGVELAIEKKEQLLPAEHEVAIENALAEGTMTDAEVLSMVEVLSGEAKARLARYLDRVIDDSKYIRVFHECFPELTGEEQKSVIQRCTVDRPQAFARVAPFVIMAGVSVTEPDTDLIRPTRDIALVECHLLEAKITEQIVGGMIQFVDRHPEVIPTVQENLRTISGSSRWIFLLPHFSEILAKNLLTEEELKQVIPVGDNARYHEVVQHLLSEEAWTVIEEIAKRPGWMKIHVVEWGRRKLNMHDIERIFERSPKEGTQIIDALLGEVRRLVGSDTRWKTCTKESLGSAVTKIESCGVPVFAVADAWAENEKELRGALREWVPTFERWNLSHEVLKVFDRLPYAREAVYEGMGAVSRKARRTSEPWYLMRPFVESWHVWSDAVSPETRTLVASTITRTAPEAWFVDLDAAKPFIEKNVDEFLRDSIRRPRAFLVSLEQLLASAKHGWLREKGVDEEALFVLVEKALTRDPMVWLQSSIREKIQRVVSHEIIERFLNKQFEAPANRWFVVEYARVCTEENRDSQRIRNALEQDQKLVRFLANHGRHPVKFFQELYGSPHAERILIGAIEAPHIRFLTDSDEFLKSCVTYPDVRLAFFKKMIEQRNLDGLIGYAAELSNKANGEGRFGLSYELNNLGNQIESAKERFGRYFTFCGASYDSLKVNEMKKEIAILSREIEKKKTEINRKKQYIEPYLVEMYGRMQKEIRQMVLEACEQQPLAIFSNSVASYFPEEAPRLIRKHFSEAFRINSLVALGKDGITYRIAKAIGEQAYEKALLSKLGDVAYYQMRMYEPNFSVWSSWIDQYKDYALPDILFKKEFVTRNIAFQKLDAAIRTRKGFRFIETAWNDCLRKAKENEVPSYDEKNCPTELRDLAFALTLTHNAPVFLRISERMQSYSLSERVEAIQLCARLVRDGKMDVVPSLVDDPLAWLRWAVLPVMAKEFDLNELPAQTTMIPFHGWNALSTYYRSDRRIHSPEFRDPIQQIAGQLLNGSYVAQRAWGRFDGVSDTHVREVALEEMRQQGLVPAKITMSQYETWIEDEKTDLESELSLHISDVQSHVRRLLQQGVADEHIPKDVISVDAMQDASNAYKDARAPLIEWSGRMEAIRTTIEGLRPVLKHDLQVQVQIDSLEVEYRSIQKTVAQYREQYGGTIDRFMALRVLSGFQHVSLRDLDARQISIPNSKERMPFARAFVLLRKSFEMYPAFLGDLHRVERACEDARTQLIGAGAGRSTRVRLEANDRVSFDSLVTIGADPVPSCQHYDGGSMNEGLLATVMDPNVRLIRVHQESGASVARSVLRLLADEEGKPHLFLERLYSVNPHEMVDRLVIELARKKARAMSVPLHTVEMSSEEEDFQDVEPVRLYSRGSRAPTVYTDAGGGTAVEGIFEVDAVRTIAV